MIWILLFTLLFASSDSAFVVPKFDKYTKQIVDDKERRTKILNALKADRKLRKTFKKEQNKNLKELSKLNRDRDATPEDFNQILEKISKERRSIQREDLKLRMLILENLNREEWDEIIETSKEDVEKTVQKKDKRLAKFYKSYDKLKAQTVSAIRDEARAKQAQEVFRAYREVLTKNIDAYRSEILDFNSNIYSFDITEEETQAVIDKANAWRMELAKGLVTAHFTIIEATTEEEWNTIVKKSRRMF